MKLTLELGDGISVSKKSNKELSKMICNENMLTLLFRSDNFCYCKYIGGA